MADAQASIKAAEQQANASTYEAARLRGEVTLLEERIRVLELERAAAGSVQAKLETQEQICEQLKQDLSDAQVLPGFTDLQALLSSDNSFAQRRHRKCQRCCSCTV